MSLIKKIDNKKKNGNKNQIGELVSTLMEVSNDNDVNSLIDEYQNKIFTNPLDEDERLNFLNKINLKIPFSEFINKVDSKLEEKYSQKSKNRQSLKTQNELFTFNEDVLKKYVINIFLNELQNNEVFKKSVIEILNKK